mmetsp:Transcript_28932/g.29272  ORF Transcript_28932/g.29272 Transcript_28932/m.29272 type:complete len:362 (-) Transcript_28932:16-1101(-)
MVRGWLARMWAPKRRYEAAGRRILAAKIILKAWVTYRDTKRLQKLVEESRIKRLAKRVLTLQEARKHVDEDLKEIGADIEAAKKSLELNKTRIKELNDFIVEVKLRVPVLEQVLNNISMEEMDRGWGEAYGDEYEYLVYQEMMSKHELRLRKNVHKKNQKELLSLSLEYEESDCERESLIVREIETRESLRKAEIGRIERKLKDIREREIRIQRIRWRIDSIRRHVIMRQKQERRDMINKLKQDRINICQSVKYESRAEQEDREEFGLQELEREREREIAKKQRTYEVYAAPVQDTYDSVVANTLSLLRGVTLDERGEIQNERERQEERQSRLAKKGVTAALKEENGVKRAFDYLSSPSHY